MHAAMTSSRALGFQAVPPSPPWCDRQHTRKGERRGETSTTRPYMRSVPRLLLTAPLAPGERERCSTGHVGARRGRA